MTKNKKLQIAGVIVVFVIVGVLSVWWLDSAELKFVELSSPKGFRTLMLETQTSSPTALFGLPSQSVQKTISPAEFCDVLLRDTTSPVLGPTGAQITIVEFFDYRCPYCRVLKDVLFQLQKERSLRIIYKEWPILSEGSKVAARAALGAANQGKYFEFHSKLMQSSLMTTKPYVRNLAEDQNIDPEKLLKDMDTPEISAALERNSALAYELGVIGTPALVVGRTIIQGAISKKQLGRLIDVELASPTTVAC
jgi:protein-disulfide isomerase